MASLLVLGGLVASCFCPRDSSQPMVWPRLEPTAFRSRVPLYVLEFLYPKRNYGAEMYELIAAMLMRLVLVVVVPKDTVASCRVELAQLR